MHFRWNDNKIIASERTRNKHLTSALEGTFGRLPYDNWVFDRLSYTDLATKTSPPPDHAKVTPRSETIKRKKAEEEERKSTNKDCHERMQRARDGCLTFHEGFLPLIVKREGKNMHRL
jgi:hypothetical protein